MRKRWLSWILAALAATLFVAEDTVYAEENAMDELIVELELLENGTGIFTETRQMNMNEGTELYFVIEEGFEVIDFYVEGMTEETEWDSNRSREEKAGTYGIIDEGNSQEFVWGIGEYGENTYRLSYTVTNVVRQLEDGQSLFWNFNTFGDIRPETFEIRIAGPQSFSEDHTRIWGFGYEGEVDLVDGQLIAYSDSQIGSGRPLSVLMQFMNDPFMPSYYDNQTLEEQLDRAEEQGRGGEGESDTRFLVVIFTTIAACFTASAVFLFRIDYKKKEGGKVPHGHAQRKANSGMMYTGIPYKEGDIVDVAYFLNILQKGSFEQYFIAYLMKWSKEKWVIIETENTDQKKKKQTTLTFLPEEFGKYQENNFNQSEFEMALWETLVEASDDNNQLTNKEMDKWAEKNSKELQELSVSLVAESKETMLKEGYIEEKNTSVLGIRIPFIAITKKGQQVYDQLTQFENHLIAISEDKSLSYRQLIPENEFLIWACLYGKEEDIISRLEDLLPNWIDDEESIPYYYRGYYGLHSFSHSMNSGMTSGGYSSSSGMGGSTSVGGGGGSYGGGGGGAR